MLKRIMADQYKPLKIKGYRKEIPKPSPLPSQLFASPSPSSSPVPSEPSPTTEGQTKQPWEYDTTFKPPEHYQPALGYRPSSSLLVNPQTLDSRGRSSRRSDSSAIKKKIVGGSGSNGSTGVAGKREQARKLKIFDAYEKTLDYKGGLHKLSPSSSSPAATNESEMDEVVDGSKDVEGSLMAGQMRVYEGFIEEKIKKAREQGLFRNVKGRGKPLPRDEEEGNPFISRDDFLINRILKTQDAAPPWIELQKELEHSLSTFRSTLSSTWVRRAIRIRSSEGLTASCITEIQQGWRDREWEQKERGYHDTAVRELNDLTRRFNIIAPYHVRRPLLTLESELFRTITSSSPHIASELSRRLSQGTPPSSPLAREERWLDDDDEGVKNLTAEDMGGEKKAVKESMWKAFRRVVVEVLGKGPDETTTGRVKTVQRE
ncbi:uncharacterized protein JCM6883_000462 [Sporobolomyces salmoneus]|uniref:uncharacterized protein n=1 Tax=Sporobolomyces salmoneus TaxID=183962 RepID=UPI003178016C